MLSVVYPTLHCPFLVLYKHIHAVVTIQNKPMSTSSGQYLDNTTWWQWCSHRDRQRMAQLRLDPPEPFKFRAPEDWPRWKRRFQQFCVASGLVDDRSAEKQVSTLLYCRGEEAQAVLASTNITEEERRSYDTVVSKFEDFFKVRRNVIF